MPASTVLKCDNATVR